MFRICMAVILLLTATPVTADESAPPNLIRAAFVDERLWLLSDRGALFSLTEQDTDSRTEDAGGRVRDLCVLDGKLVAAIETGDSNWHIRRLDGEGWMDQAQIGGDGSLFLAMVCGAGKLTVLTEHSMFTVEQDGMQQVAIKGDFPKFEVPVEQTIVSAAGTETKLYVGYNMGEWGGQLHIIDRATGQRFATHYGPITGLSPIPWKTDCVAMAVGYMHMSLSGEMSIGCPEDYDVLFTKRFGERSKNMALPEERAYQTIPFLGVQVSGETIHALGGDGLYYLTKDGQASFVPMPEFKQVGAFDVAFGLPDLVLVLTGVYRRHSISGAAPLMARR